MTHEIPPNDIYPIEIDVVEHEPGVYFGVPDDIYHADAALGSTDIKTLAYSPCDYWFKSPLNAARPDNDQTPAQLFGSAVHRLVLEGRQAFESCYAATEFNGSTKAGKAERDLITEAGKTPIKRDEFDRILAAGSLIAANTVLADAFSGGMPEVSIFWEDKGIRKKCRIDYLKVRAIVDLKSIRNTRNIGFAQACRRAISDYRYDVQAQHYREGRDTLAGFVADGAVFGDHDHAWLQRIARSTSAAFVFVFYQAEGAPLSFGTVLSPDNPILAIARETIDRAETNFLAFRDLYGIETPWPLNEPLAELELSDMPPWFART